MPTEKAHGIQIASMCAAFASQGVSVELVLPKRHNKNRKVSDLFAYYDIPRTFSVRALPIFDLTRFAFIFGRFAFALLPRSFARVARADARKNPADLYYVRDEHVFRLFAETGLPVVFEIHTMMNRPERFKEAFLRSIAIVAITHGLRDELVERGVPPEKIIVAPDGVDLKRFAPGVPKEDARKTLSLPPKERIALYTGQLFPWKGVDTLIEAATHLKENEVVLIVGGGAGRERELQRRAKKIRARVRFAGQVPHQKIPLYLAAADCVVVPTSGKEKIGRSHTSPLKLFEAMAMGKAIVASNIPSLCEVVDSKTALFFPADNATALGETLSSILTDPLRAAKLGSNAKDAISSYDWNARARYIMTSIKKLDHML